MSRRIHLVGIGGSGLSAIGRVLLERGDKVTGSDLERSKNTVALEKAGAKIHYEHEAANVAGADLVLASSAVPDDNVEIVAARAAGIPVMRRQSFWRDLMAGQRTVAVAGTHGKTTTTAMIAWILTQQNLDPGFIVGGDVLDLGTNARAGAGDVFVVEADEYDGAFLGLEPDVAVVTNVEHDHPDYFPTADSVRRAFQAFAAQVSGCLIVCCDDPGAAQLSTLGVQRITYGLVCEGDWQAAEVRANQAGGSDFLVVRRGETLGLVRTRLPGSHNVLNTLGALAAVEALDVPFTQARGSLVDFHGAGRRFEVLGEVGGVTVVDDYAHHPTEVRATLAAARRRYPERTIWAVFQPHTYSRTRAFYEALRVAFSDADTVIVTEIFAAREGPDPSISGEQLARAIDHPDVRFARSLHRATEELAGGVKEGSVVLTLSAGDANQVGRSLLDLLRERKGGANHA